jgi:small subunit ribosomal protein S12
MNRKKRASSNRKVVQVKIKIGLDIVTMYCYVRGETHNMRLLKEYSIVLIVRKGKSDLNLVSIRLLRGCGDCRSVINRKTARSVYGVKKTILAVYKKQISCNCYKCMLLVG